MAAIKGDIGKVMFHNAAGTEADVAGTRSWSLSVTKDTLETTVQGKTSKEFVGGLISGEGSAELIYDNAGNSDYLAFVEDVLTTNDAGDALFELFPDKDTAAKKIGFSGIVTGAEFGATLGEVQIINTVSYTHLRAHET